jgi:hypothetical protein
MIISRKLPPSSQRRGFISFHTSGSTFFNFGFGRDALKSADVDRAVPREGRSADFIPGAPKLEGPIEGILLAVYACLSCVARVVWVSSQRWQLSSILSMDSVINQQIQMT